METELTGWLEGTPEILVEVAASGPRGPKGEPGTSDHRDLTHRDAADQHPMEAIAGLSAALSGKVGVGDVLSNKDILRILEG